MDDDFIDKYLEEELIDNIQWEIARDEPRDWKYRGHVLRYGWDYSGTKWVEDVPRWLVPYEFEELHNSITINHYLTGQSIPPHIDSLKFDEVIEVLSLGSECLLRFTRGGEAVDVPLPPRSLLVMSGEARYEWEHQVLPCRAERFSIVYRNRVEPK